MKALHDHWRNPFVHSYLWLQDERGDRWVVEGYPEMKDGREYLQAWVYAGDVGHYDLSQARHQTLVWRYSQDDAAQQVDKLLAAARAFPRYSVPYRKIMGPNSNSFLRWLCDQAGLDAPRPDFAVAWEVELPL